MRHNGHETEIKLAVPDLRTARRLLRSAGFRSLKQRVFESNTVFDTAARSLRRNSTLLRLRQAGSIATLTYKGKPLVSRHKSREELELEIPDTGTMSAVLERLGFHPVFRYEKYRTEFQQPRSRGIATLDETPLGIFIELEGEPKWIDRTASSMGFDESAYITRSYGRLYLEWCKKQRSKPHDMLFSPLPRRRKS